MCSLLVAFEFINVDKNDLFIYESYNSLVMLFDRVHLIILDVSIINYNFMHIMMITIASRSIKVFTTPFMVKICMADNAAIHPILCYISVVHSHWFILINHSEWSG